MIPAKLWVRPLSGALELEPEMKKLAIIAFGMLVLAGCGRNGERDLWIAARDYLADPKTQQAANVLVKTARAGATLVSCFVGAGSGIALAVEQESKTKGQYATGIVYSASSKICTALGGVPTGEVVASGNETIVVK